MCVSGVRLGEFKGRASVVGSIRVREKKAGEEKGKL